MAKTDRCTAMSPCSPYIVARSGQVARYRVINAGLEAEVDDVERSGRFFITCPHLDVGRS